jgi:hypothetical protein
MTDSPQVVFPASSQSASINDNFTAYVMYKPDGLGLVADWVAIGKVVWSWGATAKNNNPNNNNPNWTVTPLKSPAPAPTAPVTALGDMFPSWTDQTLAMSMRGNDGWPPA